MTANQVAAWARGEIGQHENPWGSNRIKYWYEIGLPWLDGFAWCGAFVWDALSHGHAELGWTTARRFVDTQCGLADARAAGIFYTDRPRLGDPVWFNLDSDPSPEHVGIVAAKWDDWLHVRTIEGNVRDRVCALVRGVGQVIGYARITYNSSSSDSGDSAPEFPLPAGWYFGPRSGPKESVSGYHGHREDLRIWQAQMQARGWHLAADGLYGPVTARVTRRFQNEKELHVDGLIGPITWKAAWEAPLT